MPSIKRDEKTKQWYVRFRAMEDGKLKNKRLSGFKRSKDAEIAYTQYRATHIDQNKISLNNMTFNDLYLLYSEYAKHKLKASSYYDTMRKIENHILPYFGKMVAAKIEPRDILNWQNTLDRYSSEYRKCIRARLSAIYTYATRYQHFKSNPVRNTETFKDDEMPKEMLYWTLDEFMSFIAVVDSMIFKMFFTTLYLTGFRKGECLALDRNDYDFHDNTISITKSVTNKVQGKAWAVTSPKNKYSIRKIEMPQSYMNDMKEYFIWQDMNYKNHDFVFCSERPIPTSNIDHAFARYYVLAKVKKIRIHDFRHSHVSYLLSHGVSVVLVSKRLGHKNITETLNTYSHFLPDDSKKMLEILNNIQTGTKSSTKIVSSDIFCT